MHSSVMAFVKQEVETRNLAACDTLEVGSCNVNGSVREFFSGAYVGVDLVQGPGVDMVVSSGDDLPFADESFGVIVSTEALEHDPRPWRTMAEIARVAAPGATIIITARGYDAERGAFPVHNEPDLYRFSSMALIVLAQDAGLIDVFVQRDPQVPGWFLVATKLSA